MRIVILGANGQVAAEVAQLLATTPEVDLVPVARTRGGSAYLRSRGIAVWHGAVMDATSAAAMLAGADVIASFALAGGAGRAALTANNKILQSVINHSPPGARLIFISTLAVNGSVNADGAKRRNAYGDVKRRNERYFERAARRGSRCAWTLRLGHVCGDEQSITHGLREDIARGPVPVPDTERASNTTYVEAIAEALVTIGQDRAGPPGLYDIVNFPQWTWREVYEYEAFKLGVPVKFDTTHIDAPAKRTIKSWLGATAFLLIEKLDLRSSLERALTLLPGQVAEQVKATFLANRARREIAALSRRLEISTDAVFWPAFVARHLPGVRETRALIDKAVFRRDTVRPPWPPDLGPA